MLDSNRTRSIMYNRRRMLRSALGTSQALIPSGGAVGRNYKGNPYPFRASSHFIFLAGKPVRDAYFLSCPDGDKLFVAPQEASDIVWHGHQATLESLASDLSIPVLPLEQLPKALQDDCLTLMSDHLETRNRQYELLSRKASTHDPKLARAMVESRICQDELALERLRETIQLAASTHAKVPNLIEPGMTENGVWAFMQAEFATNGFGVAYNPIITTHGEVLHGGVSQRTMNEGDLLLLDVGCEHPEGWASDITRTWPVSGQFSTTQSLIHHAVLAAQEAAIQRCVSGTEYLSVHLAAAQSLTKSLIDIDILNGSVDELMEKEIFAYFFPHGVGHLLGLDVHDMEDLGDVAGYSPGRARAQTPGQRYLRLNRPLDEGMVVTVEPGFYQIPSLLDQARQEHAALINWKELSRFSDVRGLRIEDDILISENGPTVLSKAAPRKLE